MSSTTSESLSGSDGSVSSLAKWDALTQIRAAETTICPPILDLSPTRCFREEFRKSMSFNSWKAEDADSEIIFEADTPKITPRSSEEANNSEIEIETSNTSLPTQAQSSQYKLEALRDAAKRNLREEIHPTSREIKMMNSLTKFDVRCMPKNPSKKLMELLLVHKDSSYEESISSTTFNIDEKTMSTSNPNSCWSPTDTNFDSIEQSSENSKVWDMELESGSLASSESQGMHRRTWSTEPLDSFIDGSQTKLVRLRSIGNRRNCLDDSLPREPEVTQFPTTGLGSYKKIAEPSRKMALDQKLYFSQHSFRQRLCRKFLTTSKQVLQSVWTWTIVAVVFAGVQVHKSCRRSRDISEIPQHWTEDEDPFDFEWDEDVEFSTDVSDEEC